MVLLNGQAVAEIPVTDRGLQYGDGLFETIALRRNKLIFLTEHLARLQNGCVRLNIPYPGTALLIAEAKRLIANTEQGILKIILTRGSGGRGYNPPPIPTPTRLLSLYPYPDYPPYLTQQGINARFCHTQLSLNPALAGIKHLNRLEQVLARAEWQASSIQEGLMCNLAGQVIEGTMSNLFWVQHQVLYTAPVNQCGVAGIIRAKIIQFAANIGLALQEGYLTPKQLLTVDELFVTNSIIGIWPIATLAERQFPVGPITYKLLAALAQSE